ncbi:hypothetical protein [Bradyrhizobium lablabi]|uniref:hypothetical protein n=1 Tax=Bradyrhizobium lablabi TaxID=722472 RepID=UPI000B1191AD|nr:hypothetical protein [Bradyrhizobium lablabi]
MDQLDAISKTERRIGPSAQQLRRKSSRIVADHEGIWTPRLQLLGHAEIAT